MKKKCQHLQRAAAIEPEFIPLFCFFSKAHKQRAN